MKFSSSNEALYQKAAELSRKKVDSDVDCATIRVILAIFENLLSLFKSFNALNKHESHDAGAAIAGMMLEHYMDMKILHSDDSGEMLTRYREFFHIQKFRAAHRILSFIEDAAGAAKIDAAQYAEYKNESGGIDGVREKVIEVWGADNRGKASYPVHWSGRKCTRVIAHEFGPETEELYIRAYSIPGWHLSDREISGSTSASGSNAILDRIRNGAQLILVEASRIIVEINKDDTASGFINEAAAALRNSPDKPLPLSFFD